MAISTRPDRRQRILVCQTCPRYRPEPGGAVTAGARLGDLFLKALAEADDVPEIDVRIVNCLAGCKNPCNVALDGDGKMRLRFSRIEPDDVSALVETARVYAKSRDGELSEAEIAQRLRARLSARSPARIGS